MQTEKSIEASITDKFKIESLLDSNANPTTIDEISTPVLGTFTGIFSKLDGYSVNKRFYSRDFWTKVLNSEKVISDLASGKMIGIFEHPSVKQVFDDYGHATVRHPQNGAFVVKELWMEGDNVMGRAYLLNTPLGKLLSTYLLAKDRNGMPLIQLHVSARGYSKKDYFDSRGIDVMNPNDYFLQTFDVVMTPGIKGTRIKMESDNSEESEELSKLEGITNKVTSHLRTNSIIDKLRSELKLVNV